MERAHLGDDSGFRPPVHRYAPPAELDDVVRRYWVPVWSLPPGETSVQRVLQYPVCQVVVGPEYAWLVGPRRGLSTQTLTGSGWVVGAMLQPATGGLLTPEPIAELRDGIRELDEVSSVDVDALVPALRSAMSDDPGDPQRRLRACVILGEALGALLPVDEEGLLVNAIVDYVEHDSAVQRVSQVCERFGVAERTLQRILARRVGLSPKWLIQRRRLHEVAGRLRAAERVDLARLATDLGYADQAHLTRDFRTVTGVTPGAFAAEPRPSRRTR